MNLLIPISIAIALGLYTNKEKIMGGSRKSYFGKRLEETNMAPKPKSKKKTKSKSKKHFTFSQEDIEKYDQQARLLKLRETAQKKIRAFRKK